MTSSWQCFADVNEVGDGVKHQKVGRIKEALRCYDRALHASPDFPDALVARGALFTTTSVKCARFPDVHMYTRTDFPRAIKDLRRAAEVNGHRVPPSLTISKVAPEHKNAMNYLETTYLRAGMHAEQENKVFGSWFVGSVSHGRRWMLHSTITVMVRT